MKKKLIKFFIIVNILLTTFNTNILAQNIISGEKLEKLLIEDHIIIHDFRGNSLSNNIELNFYTDKTYLLKGRFPPPPEILGYQHIHPISGTWEIVGFGNSYVRLTDNQTFRDNNKKARLEYIFTDNGNIYFLDQYESTPRRKLYSYRSENKKERIEKDARRIEEIKEQEQIRLKKLEEEKRQLAIKREQERIKSEQIKKESEERLKKSEEERIKRENEERIRQEKEQLYNNILSLIGIAIVLSFIYYIIKFRKDLSKIFNSLNIKSADKYYLDDKTTTTFITSLLFVIQKLQQVYVTLKTEKNVFYSAYLNSKVQYNDLDKDKVVKQIQAPAEVEPVIEITKTIVEETKK